MISRRRLLQSAIAIPFVWRHHFGVGPATRHAPPRQLRRRRHGPVGPSTASVATRRFRSRPSPKVDEKRLGKIKENFRTSKSIRIGGNYSTPRKNSTPRTSPPRTTCTPDRAERARAGLHLYGQKPLTQTIAEARAMTKAAAARPKQVTQMGIQIHSHTVHKTVVATIQARHRAGEGSPQLERQNVGR